MQFLIRLYFFEKCLKFFTLIQKLINLFRKYYLNMIRKKTIIDSYFKNNLKKY